ncbi:MAG: TRAP transporter small permease, partial [Pseudomonas fluorescens]
MNALRRIWEHFEEGFIVFLLAAMTLVTFVYVILNNLYTLFYRLAEGWEGASQPLFSIGDRIMEMAQAMTWSTSLTKALFGWLIFFGLSYGVRTAGHIGVDALVRLANKSVQKYVGIVACLCCLIYAALLSVASFEWIQTLKNAA